MNNDPVFSKVLSERAQDHQTRAKLYRDLGRQLGRPVVSFFTSFRFPVMLDHNDADMLEGVLQKMDLSSGLALIISSPGGDGIAAERIIQICRSYSGTGEYWALVPSRAKSAATMVCFGASKIFMSPSSELGPVDPQIQIQGDKGLQRFSLWNIVQSYKDLFAKAIKETGNLQPYLQQLQGYDAREIKEFEDAIGLSEDIAVKALKSGMMRGKTPAQIKRAIKIFLTPEKMKAHGRPICQPDAEKCGLDIKAVDTRAEDWQVAYELYIRCNAFVSNMAAKCIENDKQSFVISIPENR